VGDAVVEVAAVGRDPAAQAAAGLVPGDDGVADVLGRIRRATSAVIGPVPSRSAGSSSAPISVE